VEIKKGVKVVVDGEAGLERAVVVQLSLVEGQIARANTAQSLERATLVSLGPGGSTVASALVAFGGGARAAVIRGTAREALRSTSSRTSAD